MSRRGFTLLEIIIAIFIFLLILGATYDLFLQSHRQAEHPKAAFKIQEDLQRCIHFLQQDLEETNVQSIQAFPRQNVPLSAQNPPGLSMLSPRDPSNNDLFTMGDFGVPRWQVYIYYTVDFKTHQLIRWEGPLLPPGETIAPPDDTKGLLPVFSPVDPGLIVTQPASVQQFRLVGTGTTANPAGPQVGNQKRVLASNIVLPGDVVANGKTNLLTPVQEVKGGFNVYILNAPNQAKFEIGQPLTAAEEFPLVNVLGDPIHIDLVLADKSETTGQFTVEAFSFQVHPRN